MVEETGEPSDTRPIGSTGDTPDRAMERSDNAGHVVDAVQVLPDKLKTVILLHHFDGLSYQEISEIVGCSPRGVETRLYRARQKLRERLNHVLGT